MVHCKHVVGLIITKNDSFWIKMNFSYKLREKLKNDLFSHYDLKALLYPASDASIHNGISRAIKSKDLIQLKRGLYLFPQKLRRSSLSKFLIANKLYGPSYISFESALSHYGFIPEAVYTTTSACYQRKKKCFKNELGEFTFEFVPCSDFFLAVTYEKNRDGALIASPLRALFDTIYLYKKKYQSIDQLYEDLRIESHLLREEVSRYSVAEIENLAKLYKKRNVTNFYLLLIKAFK